jgi:uncharacterized membrane-anchored protein
MITTNRAGQRRGTANVLSKIPAVTRYFWMIKILCASVGAAAVSYLDGTLEFGLANTTFVTGLVLVLVLAIQFGTEHYVAGAYWLCLALFGVLGILIFDDVTQQFGLAAWVGAVVFALGLAVTFVGWFATERNLALRNITTAHRESWYWLAVLFAFALGTGIGDLVADDFQPGSLSSLLLFGSAIAVTAVAYSRFRLPSGVAFWVAFVLTGPLGSSIGDLVARARSHHGLGLGTNRTSLVFLVAIVAVVSYLAISERDVIEG